MAEKKTTAKAEETKATKKTTTKKAAEATAAKKTTTKKAAETTAKKTTTKKAEATAEKTVAEKKTTTKKTAVKCEMQIQFAGKSYTQDELMQMAKDVWKYDLNQKASDLKSVELYVKPEEGAVYYVMNKDFAGSFLI